MAEEYPALYNRTKDIVAIVALFILVIILTNPFKDMTKYTDQSQSTTSVLPILPNPMVKSENQDFHQNTSRTHAVLEPPSFMEDFGLETLNTFPLQRNTTQKPCRSNCLKVKDLLRKWPSGKPKAAIYFLYKWQRTAWMIKALKSLYKNFNSEFQYPVILFYEEGAEAYFETITAANDNDPLYFSPVVFENPSYLSRPIPEETECKGKIGYRFMCQFQAKRVYEEPIVQGFKYLLRLDDDSLIKDKITYDIFQFMEDRNLMYGYKTTQSEPVRCNVGMYEATDYYINVTGIKPTFYDTWPKRVTYYNNFEISSTNIWFSDAYKDYIEYMDRLGGIFYIRWGDAPIKTIAVSMFVPKNMTYQFDDIRYQHGSYEGR